MTVDKIYLVGFMTAGKTTVARALGARLGWRAEDVDELIEARERKPIAEIFSRHGEPYFRNVEREIRILGTTRKSELENKRSSDDPPSPEAQRSRLNVKARVTR